MLMGIKSAMVEKDEAIKVMSDDECLTLWGGCEQRARWMRRKEWRQCGS